MARKIFNVLLLSEDPKYSKGGIVTVTDMILNHQGLRESVKYYPIYVGRLGNVVSKTLSWLSGTMKVCMRVNKTDIVHIHHAAGTNFVLYCLVSRTLKLFGKKVILHNHAADFKGFYNGLPRLMKKWINNTLKRVDINIVLSDSWLEWYREIVPDANWVVLRNAVPFEPDTSTIEKSKDNCRKVLFLGRMEARKGIFDLLDVIPGILKTGNRIKFMIAGDGEVKRVQATVREKKLDECVNVAGWLDTKKARTAQGWADIFVLPSHNEGLPMALLESMAMGAVPIVSDAGGIGEVVKDGYNGLLVKAGDPKSLEDAFLKLMNDDKLLRNLSSNAIKTIKNSFSYNGYSKKIIELYGHLC